MNCDQAFDAMTDPYRIDSPELSQHLKSCTRCQQMYETLEPALGLFDVPEHEPMSEHVDRPSRDSVPAVLMAQQVAARLSSSGHTTKSWSTRSPLRGTLFAVTALGLLLSLSLTLLLTDARSTSPAAVTQCSWLNRDTARSDTARSDEVASVLTKTCVSCHLSRETSEQDRQASLIIFSQQLEQLVIRWQGADNPHPRATDLLLVRVRSTDSRHV